MSMVHRRATDEKIGVRKAALQAVEAIIRMDLQNIKREVGTSFRDSLGWLVKFMIAKFIVNMCFCACTCIYANI